MSTIRARVLAGLGGCCTWCQATDKPLEIDHIQGGGNQHRKRIKMKLDVWVWREYRRTHVWPLGFQLLCTDCHHRKSGTTPLPERQSMPAKKGYTPNNIALPDDLTMQLTTLAAAYDGSKSRVIEELLKAHIEGRLDATATDGLHNHLSTATATLQSTMSDLANRVQKSLHHIHELSERIAALETQQDRNYQAIVQALYRLNARETGEKKGFFQGISRR